MLDRHQVTATWYSARLVQFRIRAKLCRFDRTECVTVQPLIPVEVIALQRPFGGARLSGTNDKVGSLWNLTRWLSPHTIKETFAPPREWRYPFVVSEA